MNRREYFSLYQKRVRGQLDLEDRGSKYILAEKRKKIIREKDTENAREQGEHVGDPHITETTDGDLGGENE